jgi:cellulose synthase/poly-beta-1,6-N-acetylglucosamine synthase-like glycosyltransferase
MLILTLIVCLAYLLLLFYFIWGWSKLRDYKPGKKTANIFFSIIVPARNEGKNITTTLQDLISQNYPLDLFEIIVVDDQSTDGTTRLVKNFQENNTDSGPKIKLIRLEDPGQTGFYAYKKRAIETGIKESNGSWILTTDADCRRGANWLNTIASFIEEKDPYFISAPVLFHNEKGFFGKIQSLEFLSLIGIGAACIANRTPNLCNGANLGYRKDIFNECQGYSGIDFIASGDDELMMHKISEKYPDKMDFIKIGKPTF